MTDKTPPRFLPVPTPAPTAAGDDLQSQLASVEGLDLAQGLMMTHNRWPLYLQLLGLLVDSHGGEAEQLRQLAAAGDIVGIRRIAHQLKGSAGIVGARTLDELASDVLAAARRQEPDIAERAMRLASVLERLVACLRGLLPGPAGSKLR